MTKDNRPLSPHLQVYRWGVHMLTSILHRGTGMVLSVGVVLFSWWLVALAAGPEYFAFVMDLALSPLGRLVLFGVTFSLMQHLASGVRHLLMDTGALYELGVNRLSARLTFVFSVTMTLFIWVAVYKASGSF